MTGILSRLFSGYSNIQKSLNLLATVRSSEEDEDKLQSPGTFCCLLRVIQLSFVLLSVYSSFVLIKSLFFVHVIRPTAAPSIALLKGAPFIPYVARSTLKDPLPSRLLSLRNFTLLLEPDKNLCAVDDLLFVMVVHSKPDHFKLRRTIRSTWGNLRTFTDVKNGEKWATRTIFVLGEQKEELELRNSKPRIRDLVKEESKQWKDIVLGSFSDHYRNLRYKHILGLRYAVDSCSNSIFFIKADDDAFIDLIGLYYYLIRTFGPLHNQMKDILAGNVFPSGTTPQRKGKWAVKASEYPWCEYPSYLGGLSYIMTPDVARDLYRIAHSSSAPEVWVDDVWITGLLAQTLRLQPLFLNPRYSYDHDEMKEWLQLAQSEEYPYQQPPYTFAHLDPSRKNWEDFSYSLWDEVLVFYNITAGNNTLNLEREISPKIQDSIR